MHAEQTLKHTHMHTHTLIQFQQKIINLQYEIDLKQCASQLSWKRRNGLKINQSHLRAHTDTRCICTRNNYLSLKIIQSCSCLWKWAARHAVCWWENLIHLGTKTCSFSAISHPPNTESIVSVQMDFYAWVCKYDSIGRLLQAFTTGTQLPEQNNCV